MSVFRLPVIFLVLCLTVRVSGSCTGSTDCPNGGTCEEGVCKCAPDYAGATCDTQGVCSDGGFECANGGTCVTSPTPTTCTCAEGYTGDTCQNDGDTVRISTFLMTLTALTFFVIL
ncbi:neurogenic locus protein delta-like [Haliotis cracherodii]|uniref:neurogenic locus protein delta-like n=1 Tax=Haliotis cracherodii TaxID=6455 RepID=UPI0039E7C16B